jgi:hypothetical protein
LTIEGIDRGEILALTEEAENEGKVKQRWKGASGSGRIRNDSASDLDIVRMQQRNARRSDPAK